MTIGPAFDDVLAAARMGGSWAWQAIYEDLAPAVTGYLRARGANDADDIVGEVFLQVVRDLASFQGGESEFRSWVFKVAHHRLLDAVRYASRRPAELRPPEDLSQLGPRGHVEDEALSSLRLGRVRALLERLSPDQQDVLLLRLFGQMTIEEVAATLGKRPGAVKALQRRGLVALQREISREGVTL